VRASISSCALLALAGSLAIGGARTVAGRQDSENQTSSPKQSATANEFTLIRAGLGLLWGGTAASVKTYRAEDGETVQLVMHNFGSPDDAMKALQDMKNRATKVTQQDQTSDKSGKIVSVRSVLILPDKGQKIATAIVLIDGSDFLEIVSYSAQDAFAFENFAKAPPPTNK